MTIGEKIKKARTDARMTQKELAEKCGMADSAIRKYESGKVTPKLDTIAKIARAMGLYAGDLVDVGQWGKVQLGEDRDAFDVVVSPEDAKRETEKLIRQKELLDGINSDFMFLNEAGQEEAAKRVQELTEIPKYRIQRPTDAAQSAAGDAGDKEPEEK